MNYYARYSTNHSSKFGFRAPALLVGLAAVTVALAAAQVQLKPAASNRKSQSEVASKAKFKVIKEGAPELKTALESHQLDAAKKLSGKEGGFYGTVDRAYETASHSVLFLDFDKDFKKSIAAVLMPSHFADLPDMKQLKGHKVLVLGKWVIYQGRPEIIIEKVGQIEVVQGK